MSPCARPLPRQHDRVWTRCRGHPRCHRRVRLRRRRSSADRAAPRGSWRRPRSVRADRPAADLPQIRGEAEASASRRSRQPVTGQHRGRLDAVKAASDSSASGFGVEVPQELRAGQPDMTFSVTKASPTSIASRSGTWSARCRRVTGDVDDARRPARPGWRRLPTSRPRRVLEPMHPCHPSDERDRRRRSCLAAALVRAASPPPGQRRVRLVTGSGHLVARMRSRTRCVGVRRAWQDGARPRSSDPSPSLGHADRPVRQPGSTI